ncbi:unnamed protein product [Orchesella dallaii]|uniref:Uncharacterized protein n=1 Tax=Orchesella dallaii TaxID=48710 RepID=A0ABP1RHZ9_9HEXA
MSTESAPERTHSAPIPETQLNSAMLIPFVNVDILKENQELKHDLELALDCLNAKHKKASELHAEVEYLQYKRRKHEHHIHNLEGQLKNLEEEIKENKGGNLTELNKQIEKVAQKDSIIEEKDKCIQKLHADHEEQRQVSIVEAENLKKKLDDEKEFVLRANKIIHEKIVEIRKEKTQRYSAHSRAKQLSFLNRQKTKTIKQLRHDYNANLKKAKIAEYNRRYAKIQHKNKLVMLKKKLKEANSEITDLNHKLQDSSEEVNSLKSERIKLNDKIGNMEAEKEALKTKMEGLNSKNLEEIAKLEETLEQKNIKIHRNMVKIEKLESKLVESERSFALKQKETKKKLEAESERARKATQMAQEDRKKVEKFSEEIEALQSKLKEKRLELKKSVDESRQQIEELNRTLASNSKEEKLKNDLQIETARPATSTQEAHGERKRVEYLRKEIESLKSELESKSNTNSALTHLIERVQEDARIADATEKELRIQVNNLKVEKECFNNKFVQKDEEIQKLHAEIKKTADLAKNKAHKKKAEKVNGNKEEAVVACGSSHLPLPKQNGEKVSVIVFGATQKEKEAVNAVGKNNTISEKAPVLPVKPVVRCQDAAQGNCNSVTESKGKDKDTCNNNWVGEIMKANDEEAYVLLHASAQNKGIYIVARRLPTENEPSLKKRRQSEQQASASNSGVEAVAWGSTNSASVVCIDITDDE